MGQTAIIVTLAWRNLWRNHRRTLIMLAAITVGVWAMIFMTALMRGMVDEMIADGVRALPGHVQVHAPDFRDDPSVSNVIDPPDAALEAALDDPGVLAWATRVKVPAVVSSERGSRGVTLIGIDPEAERALSFVAGDVVEGRYLESPDDKGVVVGAKLLERLETRLGRRIVLMSQDPDNELADRGFRIVGVFDATLDGQEESLVFAGRGTLQRMLKIGDSVSEIAVLGPDYRDVESLLRRVEAAAPETVRVEAWHDLNAYLGTMLDVMDGFVLIWMVVVFLALSFGLVNTLVMAVFERVREIGLMLALGMSPRSILAQILVESVLLLVIGLAAGNLAAVVTAGALENGIDFSAVADGMEIIGAASVIYPALYVKDVVLANVVVIVLGFFASLSPAWRASRYEPIEAITKV